MLVQLFQNLISNGIKYRRSDEVPRISIFADRSGDTWTFSVRDNGAGIDPKYHDYVFGVFKRLQSGQHAGNRDGTGDLQSRGRPARRPDLDRGERGTRRIGPILTSWEDEMVSHTVRILLAEDNAADVWLIREALKRQLLDHEIENHTTAEDAIEAIRRCGHGDAAVPDLILLDYNLPRGHGGEVLAAAVANPKLAGVPKAILFPPSCSLRKSRACCGWECRALSPSPPACTILRD